MSELPTGTVTLLPADVESSTRLWESQRTKMTVAVARLDRTRASEAAAGALELQRAAGSIRFRLMRG